MKLIFKILITFHLFIKTKAGQKSIKLCSFKAFLEDEKLSFATQVDCRFYVWCNTKTVLIFWIIFATSKSDLQAMLVKHFFDIWYFWSGLKWNKGFFMKKKNGGVFIAFLGRTFWLCVVWLYKSRVLFHSELKEKCHLNSEFRLKRLCSWRTCHMNDHRENCC